MDDNQSPPAAIVMTAKIPKADAYGGVLVNVRGEVLLREPAAQSGDYASTFAEGTPGKGEKSDEAALRIVREETGYCARIILPPNCLLVGQTSPFWSAIRWCFPVLAHQRRHSF